MIKQFRIDDEGDTRWRWQRDPDFLSTIWPKDRSALSAGEAAVTVAGLRYRLVTKLPVSLPPLLLPFVRRLVGRLVAPPAA